MDKVTKKIASKINSLQEENSHLKEAKQEVEDRMEKFEKRAKAEELLIQAKEINGAPDKFSPKTLDGFLQKRAKLEDLSEEDFKKVASFIEMMDEDGDIVPSDIPSSSSRDATDLMGWIADQS